MVFELFMVFVIPLVISLLVTPWVIRYAVLIGAIDRPNPRKIHSYPVPRLGGVAIYTSFFLSVGVLNLIYQDLHGTLFPTPTKGVMFALGLVLVLGLGIFDDLQPRTQSRN